MEAFSPNNIFGQTFSDVGFFTIPIWIGILLMSVVIVMLVFAIDMTYSIQTMDRFDSRKGKNLEIKAN